MVATLMTVRWICLKDILGNGRELHFEETLDVPVAF